jgi:hypothetical protein
VLYIVVLRVLDVIGGDMAAVIESEEKECMAAVAMLPAAVRAQ